MVCERKVSVGINLCREVSSKGGILCDIGGPLTNAVCIILAIFYVYVYCLCVVVFHAN